MSYTQTGRRLSVTTPLGKDFLILNGFTGQEAISRPFSFQLQCIAENAKKVPFESLLGQKITVEISLPGSEKKRFINGSCLRVAQGGRDATFTRYLLDLVPAPFLFLSRTTQSRIFQHVSIPDILKEVLNEFDFKLEIKGTFHPRDYCVQYRESDFAFASRLMEEEGIYYFFKHSDSSHKMVVANMPESHSELPDKSTLIFDAVGGGTREEDRVNAWEKAQELRAGKVVLWDHCFELSHKEHLEAKFPIQGAVDAGKSSHKLQLGANAPLELYDFPGAYAQRFDGIQPGGGDRPAEFPKIFQDKDRTAELRMQEQAAASVLVHGSSNCRQLVSGHKFTLERHFEGDGPWVLYQIEHVASDAADVRSGSGAFSYQNHFSCFPAALPFRPPRVTPIPTVRGTQTAVVVGPPGEEIFTDKYSRIKVQFHWHREGRNNSDSSCWIRVATPWAGTRWGAIHIPRIGQEVVVDFLEGDMDQPIVIGSVYNAECMPPYELPAHKTQSGIKSRSSLGGGPPNYNEIRFEDKKGHEQVLIHAEKNQDIEVEANETHWVGHDRTKTIDHDETTHVKHDRMETVDNNETITIGSNRTETVGQNETITIGSNRTETVEVAETISVGANRSVTIGANGTWAIGGALSLSVGGALNASIGDGQATSVEKSSETTIGKKYSLVAGDEIKLQTGEASITLKNDGTIQIKGKDITISGTGKINVKAGGNVVMKGSKISQN